MTAAGVRPDGRHEEAGARCFERGYLRETLDAGRAGAAASGYIPSPAILFRVRRGQPCGLTHRRLQRRRRPLQLHKGGVELGAEAKGRLFAHDPTSKQSEGR